MDKVLDTVNIDIRYSRDHGLGPRVRDLRLWSDKVGSAEELGRHILCCAWLCGKVRKNEDLLGSDQPYSLLFTEGSHFRQHHGRDQVVFRLECRERTPQTPNAIARSVCPCFAASLRFPRGPVADLGVTPDTIGKLLHPSCRSLRVPARRRARRICGYESRSSAEVMRWHSGFSAQTR